MLTAEELKKQFNDNPQASVNEPNMDAISQIGSTPVVEPTVGEAFSGVVSESAEEKAAREAIGSGIQADADLVIDEDAIRKSTTDKFQSEIDALDKIFAEKKRVEGIAGEGRIGESGARQARRGLLGSDFGASQTESVRGFNTASQDAIAADKANQLATIYSKIRDSADAELEAKKTAKSLGTTNYLAYLRNADTRKKQSITDTVSNMVQLQVVPTPADFNSIAEQLGVSVDDVKVDYKNQFDAKQLALQTAQSLSDKEALDLEKTRAEIGQIGSETGLTEAEAGYKERQTTQFDIDDMRATNKIRADFEQQAFDNDITLADLELDRAKYATDVEFKNANLDLETAKAEASIDKIYSDIETAGAMTPIQKVQLEKAQGELDVSNAAKEQAKIQAGETSTTLQEKIDGINKLLGIGVDEAGNAINVDTGLSKVVGYGALGRMPMLDKLSFGLLSDPEARSFSSGVRQLISQETLDTLTALKKSGATLGAISEKELAILQGAATQINDWEVLDDEGKPTGKWNIDEQAFKDELTKIKTSTERLRDAAKADAEAGEGVGNRTSFDDMNQFLLESSSIQIEAADNLKAEFPDLSDDDLIDLINEQARGSDFKSVASDTQTGQGMRTDRHNNPTAFTIDIAKQGGLKEGVDYEVGDAFPNNPNQKTARLLGDPVEQTIKVIDRIGFFTGAGNQRWTHTAVNKEEWENMSIKQKKDTVKKMYQKEGNKGVLNNYFV